MPSNLVPPGDWGKLVVAVAVFAVSAGSVAPITDPGEATHSLWGDSDRGWLPLGAVDQRDEPDVPSNDYIVGVYDFRDDYVLGAEFHGGKILRLNSVLKYLLVETDTPSRFLKAVEADDNVRYVHENGFVYLNLPR